MRIPSQLPAFHRQQGAVLMIMLVILVIGIATVLVSSFNSSAVKIERDKTTSLALAQAKEALIGYAITYAETHTSSPQVDGYLPCPDTDASNGEGSSILTCSSQDVSSIGRLPWKTLDLEPLRDGYGECLWYVVSGTYKNNPKTGLMNWDNKGLLSVTDANGNTVSDVVAVVFAAGPVLSGQDRAASGNAPLCGGNYTASNYLDSDGTHDNSAVSATAATVSNYYSGNSGQINDRLIYITRQDIWNAMLKRSDFMTTLTNMTQQVANCIAWYGKNNSNNGNLSLPWPAPLALADYTVNSNYDDQFSLYQGRVPAYVNTSKSTTSNLVVGSSNLLLSSSVCPTGWAAIDPWWNNWKDHLFYAIGKDYAPIPSSQDTNNPCNTCIQANGHGPYAAVVMFAGQALTGQDRTDKSLLSAYLEGRNYSNYPNSFGNANYQSGVPSGTFNDVLYCIDQNLNVAACP
jgi:type II secretory pathway pseudopilin PulG